MSEIRRTLVLGLVLAWLIALQEGTTAASSGPFVRITIAPASGEVEYSIIQKNRPMQHGRTAAVISRTIAKEAALALVAQAQPGKDVYVTVTEGGEEHASARGRNVSLTVVGGRASVSAFD